MSMAASAAHRFAVRPGTVLAGGTTGAMVAGILTEGQGEPGSDEATLATPAAVNRFQVQRVIMLRHSLTTIAVLLLMACGSRAAQSPLNSSSILEFRLVHPEQSSSSIPVQFESSLLHLDPRPVVSDRDIVSARPIERSDQVILSLELTSDAAARMGRVTSENIGSRMALLINGQVISVVVIQSAVAMRNVQVAVPRPAAEAARLSSRIHAKWPADQDL